MSDRWLAEYEGGVIHEVEMECIRCGHRWEAQTYTEYGTVWFVSDDDLYCGECGAEADG